MPDKFIPLFERNGFISKLDDYMFSSVARQQAEWKIKDMKTVPVSVNLSRAHFVQDDLANSIAGIVDSYGIDHKLVEVEITESAFVDNKGVILDTVNALREKGFTVSMDDFGSVYSSLNTLKDLPLDVVKIDKEFFSGDAEKGNLIVSSVIRLAKSLKMKIVAEGVEIKEQVDFLASENCDMIQGYYYAKPMPVNEFEELVARDA
jgi:EAL domain-containing protein (putative c-di-GMP-specific phosphodiesterase class I)